jgi:riboflavin kinase/FMN adenylyltransferase
VKVYSSLEEFPRLEKAVVTIGTFDGVHIGHQRIIRRLLEIAREQQGETVVLTFFPHPRMVLQPEDNSLQLITTLRERQALLSRFGVEHLIVQPFNKEFSRITAAGFVRDLLVKRVGMRTLVIGYDHHFGRNREGSFKDLEEMAPLYGFGLEEIPKQVVNELAVSSTKIRAALLNGDMDPANALLGHDFTLTGNVVQGDRLGRTIGFPTANLDIPESYKLIPADGIYAVWAEVSGVRHRGMLYIGNRPVVNGRFRNIEVNLFDFDSDIYGKEVTVHIKSRIRDDRNVGSMEELRLLLEEDRRSATKILS